MNEKVLIVEDQFIEANDLKIMLEKSGYTVCGFARSVNDALTIIKAQNPTLVLVDILLKGPQTGIDLAKKLHETNTAFIYISANSNHEVLEEVKATQPYGFLVKPFRKKDLLVTLEIAHYRHEKSQENEIRKAGHFKEKLEAILDKKQSLEDKMLHINMALQAFIPFDFAGSGYITQGPVPYNALNFLRVGFEEYQVIGINELQEMTNLKMNELKSLQQTTPVDLAARFYTDLEFEAITAKPSMKKLYADTFRLRSNFVMPIHLFNGEVFYFFFYSRRPDAYNQEHVATAHRLHNYLAEILYNLLSVEKIEMPLSTKKHEEVKTEDEERNATFEGIIGNSHLLLNVFDYIVQVAPVNTSVLILGERGTGKERIADCIHKLSPRKNNPLIKINCAALPTNLIESELFGYEKEAFTDATDRHIGKFELADGGTLFLDEIGELPLELQAKLLRVLQEKEIERIGGKQSVKIDVRIIAATNRSLEKEVGEGRFRLDLYYRLNIFPIQLPSLRERMDDIPLLADHFIALFNKKTGKQIMDVSNEVLQKMLHYHWPGNIRELENAIERSVLLARGNIITDIALQSMAEMPTIAKHAPPTNYSAVKSFEENERDHIISVLQLCKGKIWGKGGAAEMLNIPPTTLNSKMKKLSIKREYI
ncbi:response regulator [Flavobacterium sp. Sd200]|uniref:sigma 54-interacting response regulator n=1 Tax=Flavobacterium sp. Sd200 TaxID=2692211 RepID=UPI0013695011|nr:sigma 54-interacting response regulator [Flavobacterium sp. Sd200]MXN90800.1 response regulator [Flavobacterium sp. Sd200]